MPKKNPRAHRGPELFSQVAKHRVLGHKTWKWIASELGVSRQTLYNVTRDPEFEKYRKIEIEKAGEDLRERIRKINDSLEDQLKKEGTPSINRLVQLRDYAEKETVRLDAAKALLSFYGIFSGQGATGNEEADAGTFKVSEKVSREFDQPKPDADPVEPPEDKETIN